MSIVQSLLRKHKKAIFFQKNREQIEKLSSMEITFLVQQHAELMTHFQLMNISRDFSEKVITIGLSITHKNIKHIRTRDSGKLLVDTLCKKLLADDCARLLKNSLPLEYHDQHTFDYIVDNGFYFSLRNCPEKLITKENSIRVARIGDRSHNHIPKNMIDAEIALILFKGNPAVFKSLDRVLQTQQLSMEGAVSPTHISVLPPSHVNMIADAWMRGDENVGINAFRSAPKTAQECLVHCEEMLISLSRYRNTEERDAMRTLYHHALRSFSPQESWDATTNEYQRELVIEVMGVDILTVKGLPYYVKRRCLSNDLEL